MEKAKKHIICATRIISILNILTILLTLVVMIVKKSKIKSSNYLSLLISIFELIIFEEYAKEQELANYKS